MLERGVNASLWTIISHSPRTFVKTDWMDSDSDIEEVEPDEAQETKCKVTKAQDHSTVKLLVSGMGANTSVSIAQLYMNSPASLNILI